MGDTRITAVILAGGRSRRMGDMDKGLMSLQGKPLVQHVIERIAPQVHTLFINANRNHDLYANFGHPVFGDDHEGFLGPLAGIAAALERCTTDYLLVIPCDTPFLPTDLAATLLQRLESEQAELCVAHDGQRLQPLIALISRHLEEALQQDIRAGHLKVERWMRDHTPAVAPFDRPQCFININDQTALQQAEELCR